MDQSMRCREPSGWQPDLDPSQDDPALKAALLRAADIGWHCPRHPELLRRLEGFVDPASPSFDGSFKAELLKGRMDWFYDFGEHDLACECPWPRRFGY
jgi:hypothetical protein